MNVFRLITGNRLLSQMPVSDEYCTMTKFNALMNVDILIQ